ncbi:HDOD domain-containing protein [Solimicrobium silvestre]|uniref:HDIG: uncharacterized domain HDIG n=1 Tax=Solimicrobium silvestre TaxID=2099400 RepID=A0A2S9H051_9BURK|nr:HDOD domain-containing protein [Solimicrobium silvestre]PRC93362.1 HDIG: uncharacterized domain HDIG [Solimicrobium silvestre]
MKNIDPNEISNSVQKLPALSAIVVELLSSIDQENIDIDDIAKKISYDHVLTIKTLRLANSSFYGMQHKISSVHEAIVILGFRNVRMLIATSAITSSFSATELQNFSFPSFWRHSIGTAVCAKEIAAHIGSNQEYAFIAGLIHDIGKLVLATQYSGQYEKTLEYQELHNCDPLIAERETLGTDHSAIGTIVAKHWKFPEEMQLAVSQHHPEEGEQVVHLAGVIHLANIFALALDFSNDERAVVPKISPFVWDNIKLDEQACNQIFVSSAKKFEEIAQILIT